MQKKISYSDLLKNPQWQKKRLKILERDKWKCKFCGETNEELQIHHKYYEYNKKPWEYDEDSLITLCKSCHQIETYEMKEYQPLFLKEFKNKFKADDFRALACFFNNLKIDERLPTHINLNRIFQAYYLIHPICLIENKSFQALIGLVIDRFMYLYGHSNTENHQDSVAFAYNILCEKLEIE